MSDVVNCITYMTQDFDLINDKRPLEEIAREGTAEILEAIANTLRERGPESRLPFPLEFPLILELEIDKDRWDAHVRGRLRNARYQELPT